MVLDSNFKEFIQLLNAHGVKYLVVGGFAVAFHGHPRYTKDIDFWIWAEPENAERIIRSIQDFGLGSLGLQPSDFLNPENVIQLGYEPNRIDLLTQMEGIDFEECYRLREEVEFEGIPLNFIDLDHLLVSKRIAGRLKDLADVEKLEKQKLKKRKK